MATGFSRSMRAQAASDNAIALRHAAFRLFRDAMRYWLQPAVATYWPPVTDSWKYAAPDFSLSST